MKEVDSYSSNNAQHLDTDSPYIHEKHWFSQKKYFLIGEKFRPGKNDNVVSGKVHANFRLQK